MKKTPLIRYRSLCAARTPNRLAFALLCVLTLAGCGEVVSGRGGPDAQPAANPTAPTVTISPADGARGVLVTDPIVLTFSEPMDTASVEAAWSSSSLPANMMSFRWDATGSILTVDASAALAYPVGDESVDVYSYDFTLDATATDAQGDTLDNAITSGFHTARDVSMQLGRIAAATGSFDTNGVGSDIRIGDNTANVAWRGFVTIDLSRLPAVVKLTSATLFARQIRVVGAPYADLGKLQLVQLSPMAQIDIAAYQAIARSTVGMFSNSTAVADPGGNRSIAVTDEIATDISEGSSASSYRLEFETANDNGTDDDHVTFDPTSVRLDVRLLAE